MTSLLLFVSPLWILIASIILFFISRKSAKEVFGKLEITPLIQTGLLVLVQLLVVSLALEYVSTFLGVNDLQNVHEAVERISGQGTEGALALGVSAFAEEVFFRGIIFTFLSPIASVVLFGIAHAGYGSLIELTGALLAGYILMRARHETKSIFPGFLGHFLYNLVAVFVLT